jgi:Protein of unknown function (DUF3606)
MYTNPLTVGNQDAARIHLDDPLKVNYWLGRYKLSLDELKTVIKTVGTSIVADVEKYLTSHKRTAAFQ